MNKRPRRLKDLLKEESTPTPTKTREEKVLEKEAVSLVDVNLVSPNPFQPRRFFDVEKMVELTESIKEHGIFQPLVLKAVKDGYLIVAGERRFRAAKQLGHQTVPAIIRDYDQSQLTELSLIENLQREDLTPIEEAEAYQMLQRAMSLTHQELAFKVSKSRSYVTNVLGLLNLPDEVKELLNKNAISMGHARVLSKLDDPKRIKELAERIVLENLSVRQIETLARSETKTHVQQQKAKPKFYLAYEQQLKKQFGFPVSVSDKKLTIRYKGEEDLEKLINLLLK